MYAVATVVCAGLGVGAAVALALAPPPTPTDTREARRRAALRVKSAAFRTLEGPVLSLAAALRTRMRAGVERVRVALDALGEEDWRPEEYLAAHTLPLLPVSVALAALAGLATDATAGALLAIVLVFGAPYVAARRIAGRAEQRVRDVRARLPHTLDLMALVLEAGGGTLFECLEFAVAENADTPLGEELRRAAHGIAQGAPAAAVFGEIGRRLNDPDVAEVTTAVAASETHGQPLKESLKAVAARLRVRQVQWLEQASERAKVHITWPVMLVMVACLVIIVAPVWLGATAGGSDLIP